MVRLMFLLLNYLSKDCALDIPSLEDAAAQPLRFES